MVIKKAMFGCKEVDNYFIKKITIYGIRYTISFFWTDRFVVINLKKNLLSIQIESYNTLLTNATKHATKDPTTAVALKFI